MTPELISKTIKAALQKWSYVADLTFTEVKEGEADIMILFTAGDHGDQFKFDGPGKALAHAFYPSQNTGKHAVLKLVWSQLPGVIIMLQSLLWLCLNEYKARSNHIHDPFIL